MTFDEIAHPRPKHKGSKQLFENPWLERLTRTHIAIPVCIFFLYSGCLLAYCVWSTPLTVGLVLPLFISGLLIFTLAEYWVHRSVYHIKAHTERMAIFQYKVHGVHHEFPKDKDRLAMPPWLSVIIGTTLLWAFQGLWGHYGLALLSGFMLGYALYLLMHYSTHAFSPPKNAFKVIWENHAIHHYKDTNLAFGVSSPIWDYVFGTAPKKVGK